LSKFIICGLPGLYQNWLSAALDPNSKFIVQGINFSTLTSNIPWVTKHSSFPQSSYVINCYINNENLPWYLYNFFEKTDDINISVDNLVEDLQRRGPGTVAFDSMLDHWKSVYQIDSHSDYNYYKNSLIEYFYNWFTQESEWRDILTYQHTGDHSINIEYCDFSDPHLLYQKLNTAVDVDQTHFDQMYKLLQQGNQRFFDLPVNFDTKLLNLPNTNELSIIELAWLGKIFDGILKQPLDWFNPDIRHAVVNTNYLQLSCFNHSKDVTI
jgi:hypothetical protein